MAFIDALVKRGGADDARDYDDYPGEFPEE